MENILTLCPPALPIARVTARVRLAGTLELPRRERGNTLRGALGYALARAACQPACGGFVTCADPAGCAYRRIFRSSGPTPYVVRPPLTPEPVLAEGEVLGFEVRLFGHAAGEVEIVNSALRALPLLSGVPVASVGTTILPSLEWWLSPYNPTANSEVEVAFYTPTHLKEKGFVATEPTLPLLIKHITGRIADLCRASGGAPWDADLRAIRALALSAERTHWEGEYVRVFRRSSATGKVHPIGGFVGSARFSGVAPGLLPILRMGSALHIGHATAWGRGWYELV